MVNDALFVLKFVFFLIFENKYMYAKRAEIKNKKA